MGDGGDPGEKWIKRANGGRDLRTVLKVQLYPENNRKILMSFQIRDEVED